MTEPGARQAHRLILVTGASGGIGASVARHLAALGDQIVLIGRRRGALEDVCASLPGGPHLVAAFDVSDEGAWAQAAQRLWSDQPVSGLVTAAGVLGPVGPPGSWDLGAFRRTLEVNLIGTLLAILTLLAPLRATRGAVVAFSGGGATSPLPRYDAYAASKTALVRLVENLASELTSDGVRVNCVAPGFIATDIHRATLEAGPELAGADYYQRTLTAIDAGGDTPQLAAELTAFLLSDEAEGITGRLVSARWDPWKDLDFRARLQSQPDFAKLRRIDDQFFSARPRG